MTAEVRYCTTSDGVRIAFCVEGDGPPLLITPYLGESFSQHDRFPAFAEFMQTVAEGRAAIRFDWRGTGLSQRAVDDFSLDGFVRDIEAVVAAVAPTRLALFASTSGGVGAITYATRHPERVSRLALYGVGPGWRYIWTEEMHRSFGDLARANWPMAVRAYADLSLRDVDPEAAGQQADILQHSVSGEVFAAIFNSSYEWDVMPILGEIAVPTLVTHRLDDAVIPFSLAQEMASQIPNARFVPVPGNCNQPAGGDPRPILDAIHRFLDEDPEARALTVKPRDIESRSVFRTVLFTDLVGHTEMMRRLGDDRGRDVLREHERITRDLLKQHGGAEVKTMGDGFMASFGSVTKAMDCAIALQRAFAAHTESMPEPLHVRVGLNAGEPIEEDDDLFGSTVIMASRIAARAGAGEILIPEPLRHLLTGKSYVYADRGETMLKGFEDAVRLFEVRWQL
jgi:class 3 adenylate cyclase/pimeloyl-ACP methyl ester carboxylesterase